MHKYLNTFMIALNLCLLSCERGNIYLEAVDDRNQTNKFVVNFADTITGTASTTRESEAVEINGLNDQVNDISISGSGGNNWDIFELSKLPSNSLDVSGLDDRIVSIRFNTNGSKMYFLGNSTDTIYQYSLASPFNLASASYDNISLNVNSEDDFPRSIAFSTDGSKLYMLGNYLEFVHQYTLATPFDLATATYDTVSFKVGTQDNHPHAITFNSDGSKMFMVGDTTMRVHQYTLTKPWNLGTMVYDNISLDISSEMPMPFAIRFDSTGRNMNIICRTNNRIYKYNLNTPYDLTTANYSNASVDLSSMDTTLSTFGFNSTGDKAYIGGWDSDKIFEVNLGSGGHPEYRICADKLCSTVLYTWRDDSSGKVTNGNYVQLRTTSASKTNTKSFININSSSFFGSWSLELVPTS